MDSPEADAAVAQRTFRLGGFLRDQLRNIAPFATLLILVGFFSFAGPPSRLSAISSTSCSRSR